MATKPEFVKPGQSIPDSATVDPRLIEVNYVDENKKPVNRSLMAGRTQTNGDYLDTFIDSQWAKSAFLIGDKTFLDDQDGAIDRNNRYWSSANAKFTDTRLGCNIGINAKPQFTRYSDIRNSVKTLPRNQVSPTNSSGNYGMGRYYSEAIDDPSQTIYMRFGVPQFSSLTTFLINAFNGNMSSLARTGRTSTFYKGGKVVGSVFAVVAFPVAAAGIAASRLLDWVLATPTSKYYTMKPTMHLYWSTVNTLVNYLAINKGIFPKVMGVGDQSQRLGNPYTLDTDHLSALSNLMPDVFTKDNYFDVHALANRAQRVANAKFIADYDALNNASSTAFEGYVKKNLTGDPDMNTYISNSGGKASLEAMMNIASKLQYWFGKTDNEHHTEQNPKMPNDTEKPDAKKDPGFFSQFAEYFDAEFSSGSQFAIFKVDHTGSVNESFSNSVMESDLSEKLNAMSSTARQVNFSFANGNIVGGVLGDIVQGSIGAVKDTLAGALSGITMGLSDVVTGLLSGVGYLDIPKHWQSSTANLPRSNYTIQLISPYGNVISQMQDIYIPLCMLLAAALPRSTGKSSYTSPFLCQLFDKGRCQTKLGMIESLTITRGTSNLAFNTKGNPLAIDVTFTVIDLSSIMHMPISGGGLFEFDAALDEDSILTDYLAVLAGQDIYSQMFPFGKARMRIAKLLMQKGKLSSPAYWAAAIHDSATSGMLQYLTLGAGHLLEGFAREPEAILNPQGKQ